MKDIMIFTVSPAILIVLIVLAALLLGVLIFVLYKFVFVRKKIARQIKELERKYSYLNALIIGQDSQYIRRLEIISRTNLLYVDIFSTYSKRYKSIYDIDDKFAEGSIKQLHSLVKSKQYKNIKAALAESKNALATFEKNSLELDKNLSDLLKPEEEARQAALKLKENYRVIKQRYFTHQIDLENYAHVFETVFKKIEDNFSKFEELVESASYDDANNILPSVERVLGYLSSVLEKMPQLSSLVSKIIPEKIAVLKNQEKALTEQGYPLYHLLTSQTFEDFSITLDNLSSKLDELNIEGVEEKCNKMLEDIEKLHLDFEKEVTAHSQFNDNCDVVYHNVMELEKAFLRLWSLIPQMNKYYIISDEDSKKITSLKDTINNLTNSKRMLDTFIHSATKQPYSLLVSKLDDLSRDYDVALEKVNNLKMFLDSLRTTAEEGYHLVFSYYDQLKEIESKIFDIALEEYSKETYKPKIDILFELLNEINSILKVTPIDISLLTNKVDTLKTEFENFKSKVESDFNYCKMAESSMIYANKYRHHQSDFHQSLLMYENDFFTGDFKKAYSEVAEFLVKARAISDKETH